MGRWSRWVVAATVTAILVVLLVPETLLAAAQAARNFGSQLFAAVDQPIPQPLVIGLSLVVLFVLSFVVIFGAVRLFTSVGTKSGERVARWYDRLTPNSPRTKALAFMLIFTVVFIGGLGAFAPWLATSLAEDTNIDDVVQDIEEGRYSGNMENLFADDAVLSENPTVQSKLGGVDTDGDRLPDTWEEAGETPSGAALPEADPGQLDLYVQINYGENVSRLTATERSRLAAVWANMPVENPDGTTGIDLHLLDRRDSAGRLDTGVIIDAREGVDQYYSQGSLGERYCVYNQVTLGQVRSRETIGYAETPGYAAVVDGSRFANYNGRVPFRVSMLTHSLLHTVVGTVDGDVHTDGGWLDYPDRANEQLSSVAAEKVESEGFVTTEEYRQQCSAVANAST